MRHISGLLALLLVVSGCGAHSDEPSLAPTTAVPTVEEESLEGMDMPDELLIDGGLTPVRTMTAACSVLFDDQDVPALAVAGRTDDVFAAQALQEVLMAVAYSGPDVLRDDAGALIDHLDLSPPHLDAASRAEAQEHADALVANCADVRG